MTVKKDIIKKAYEPYYKEAFRESIVGFFGTGILMFIAAVTTGAYSQCLLAFFILYSVLFIILNLTVILGIIEQIGGSYVSKKIIIKKISEVSINPNAISNVGNIYPELLCFGKYRVICVTEDGYKIRLRCAISADNCQLISDSIEKYGGWKRAVTYGKFSKIIISYDDQDEEALILNRRKNYYKFKSKKGNRKKWDNGISIDALSDKKPIRMVADSDALAKLLIEECIILMLIITLIAIIAFWIKIKLIIAAIIIATVCFLCRSLYYHLIFMPMDIVSGSVSEKYMLSPMVPRRECIIAKDICLLSCNFYKDSKSIRLDLPVNLPVISNEADPSLPIYNKHKDTPFEVRYLKHSKILLECSVLDEN